MTVFRDSELCAPSELACTSVWYSTRSPVSSVSITLTCPAPAICCSICVSRLIRICIFFCRICALFCLISCFLISQAKHVSYTILLSHALSQN